MRTRLTELLDIEHPVMLVSWKVDAL